MLKAERQATEGSSFELKLSGMTSVLTSNLHMLDLVYWENVSVVYS